MSSPLRISFTLHVLVLPGPQVGLPLLSAPELCTCVPFGLETLFLLFAQLLSPAHCLHFKCYTGCSHLIRAACPWGSTGSPAFVIFLGKILPPSPETFQQLLKQSRASVGFLWKEEGTGKSLKKLLPLGCLLSTGLWNTSFVNANHYAHD